MTATNLYCSKLHNTVFIVTDAAVYDANGVVSRFESKVHVARAWHGIITGRGHAWSLDMLGVLLEQEFDSFDSAVAGIGQTFPRLIAEHGLSEDVELIIAGISAQRHAPESYVIYSNGAMPKGGNVERDSIVPDAKLIKLPDGVWGPQLTGQARLDCAYPANPTELEIIDTLKRGIERQRNDDYGGCGYRIGGYAELTTVSLDRGIEQRRLIEWPDEIGEPIQPAGAEPMSRLKRDMLARKAGKAA